MIEFKIIFLQQNNIFSKQTSQVLARMQTKAKNLITLVITYTGKSNETV